MKRKASKLRSYWFYRLRRKKLEANLRLAVLVLNLLQTIFAFWFLIHHA